ncbi:hypothetical protein RUND412_003587 [Rhizina undulata]
MPHAENTLSESGPSSPTYKSLDHLKSFPIVSDSIKTFESHPLGQRSISLSHTAYSTFIAPLSPYLSKAAPYVTRADELADGGLVKIETRFPIVKEPTETIKNKVNETIGYPRKLVGEVYVRGTDFAKEKKEYVFKVYEDEVSKEGNKNGYIPMAKAGVTAGYVVSADLMNALASYLGSKKEDAKEKVKEKK